MESLDGQPPVKLTDASHAGMNPDPPAPVDPPFPLPPVPLALIVAQVPLVQVWPLVQA
jgi:hypothetical protein